MILEFKTYHLQMQLYQLVAASNKLLTDLKPS